HGYKQTVEETRIRELEEKLAEARTEAQKYHQSVLKAEQELSTATREVEVLQRSMADTRQQVNSEIVDQLRRQYDQKIQEMIQQKTQLSQELHVASTMLASERARFTSEVAKSKSETTFDAASLDAEVRRVESMIQEIDKLISDPETELSTVIRKNVEKAELDAYLRGI